MIQACLAWLLVAAASAAPASAPVGPGPQPPPAQEKVFTPLLEQKLDIGLQRAFQKKYEEAAVNLYTVVADAPESELKRDEAEFSFGQVLEGLGLSQAAVEYYIEVIKARRSQEMVGRSLGALSDLSRRRLVDEDRLIDEVLFGAQFGDLPNETNGFVEYHQALGELRRGMVAWGTARLEALARNEDFYGQKARYALAIARLNDKNEEGAEKLLVALADTESVPKDVRNDARTALARYLYGHKKFTEAFAKYSEVDAPLSDLDLVLLEKAWTKVADRDERRALGMVTGFGAPLYRHTFAPERDLIRAVALNRLCQFRPAHLTVLAYRDRYRDVLEKIRERKALDKDPLLREAALSSVALAKVNKLRERLLSEKERTQRLPDARLKGHLRGLYDLRLALADAVIARSIPAATDQAADELLRIDEQMNIIDYEISVGLFKRSREESLSRERRAHYDVPLDSHQVFYRFDGEYWSDELNDFTVFADDRCVQ